MGAQSARRLAFPLLHPRSCTPDMPTFQSNESDPSLVGGGSEYGGEEREQQLRLLVEEVKEYAIFLLDTEGMVTTWNEGARRIKGYTEDEIVGKHFSTFYPAEDVEAGRPTQILKAAAEEGQWTDEGWRVRKDGARFWANVTITALPDDEGGVRGFAKVTRDMTDWHRHEAELEQQKQRAEAAKRRAHRENTLLRLLQRVATTANDARCLAEAVEEGIAAICAFTDWPVGHVYWLRRDEGPYLESSGIWSLADAERFDAFRRVTEASTFALNESLPGRVAKTGAPVWITDVTADASFVRTARANNLGVKGAFGVPVRADGDTVAVLEFFSDRPEEPDAKLMEAMASVGVQLSRVAERERAQDELRRSEKRYRRLFEASREGIVIQATDWTITDVNPATVEILGYDRDVLIGRDPMEMGLFADPDQYRRAQRRVTKEGQFRNVEFDLRRRDGTVIVCEATAAFQRDADDEAEALYTIFRDVTDRKRVQEALAESERRYRRLFEESRDAIVLTTSDGTIVDANGAAEALFGYSYDDLLDLNAAALYADPGERARRVVPSLEEASASHLLEAEMRHREGHTFLASASVTVHRGEGGHPELIQALVRDVTERRRLEEELLQIQDEERQRLGQELHDGVGSLLTAAGITISALAADVRAGEQIDPSDLDEATEYVKQAGDEARAISHGLSPVGLERGLTTALEELATQTGVRGELDCSFAPSSSVPALSEETAIHLYRIAQEAANNAAKHAGAQHVRIRLSADDETLTLVVQDDGAGLPESLPSHEGLGLRTMRYRANIIGASLVLEDAPGGGALVRCEWPLAERG